MALNIKDSETDRLARELARATGMSITSAVNQALRDSIKRAARQHRGKRRMQEIEAILKRIDALPVLDSRSPDEILGYDENGLPT